MTADLDIYGSQLAGEQASIERWPVHDRWRAEPADECGDGNDVELIDQAGAEEAPLSPPPASETTHPAPSSVRIFASANLRSTRCAPARR